MSETIKIAVIGVGIMGKSHVKDIAVLGNTELVAVCDIDPAVADYYAAETNATPYYDYHDLLNHPGLEAIIVSAPHYDHPRMSIDALQRGIHVLVEKPIAVHVK